MAAGGEPCSVCKYSSWWPARPQLNAPLYARWFGIMKRTTARCGIRIRGHRGHPAVRGALIRFARWLRETHEFPIRVPVYLSAGERVQTVHGEWVSASFFAPWDREVEPYIRIATGDYPQLCSREGRDDVLASYIASLAHEVVHYQQWVATGETHERGVARAALRLLRRYAATVARP